MTQAIAAAVAAIANETVVGSATKVGNQDRQYPFRSFMHFRDDSDQLRWLWDFERPSPATFGGLTVCFELKKDADGQVLMEYAIANCSWKDKFSRPLGRLISENRLNGNKGVQCVYGIIDVQDARAYLAERAVDMRICRE